MIITLAPPDSCRRLSPLNEGGLRGESKKTKLAFPSHCDWDLKGESEI